MSNEPLSNTPDGPDWEWLERCYETWGIEPLFNSRRGLCPSSNGHFCELPRGHDGPHRWTCAGMGKCMHSPVHVTVFTWGKR